MKKHVMLTLMLLTCIVAVRPKANAQQTTVDVPYNFVAAGKLLQLTLSLVSPLKALFVSTT
jgi:hypothetical protein